MLRTYKPIEHDLFKVHEVLEILVKEAFCQADKNTIETKIKESETLIALYENASSDWFKTSVNNIYTVCKTLTEEEKQKFSNIFDNNNQIENLCLHPAQLIPITSLNESLQQILIPFFKELYDRILEWKSIKDSFGTKEDYYNQLIRFNDFALNCPCCGYGILRDTHNSGYSAFDHYLPIRHYPFSVINFNNLFPLCDECNSKEKGQKDILASGKKVFYPASATHPDISIHVYIDSKNFINTFSQKQHSKSNWVTVDIVCDETYQEEIESWNTIFNIKQRYSGQIAERGKSWLSQVKKKYENSQRREGNSTLEDVFNEIIEDDSNIEFGFLKSPYLEALKNNHYLINAMLETRNDSKIDTSDQF